MTMRHMHENNNARINSMMGIRGGSQFVVPVIDKTQFTFGNAGTTNINLAQVIDTTGWVSGVLATRCYSTATWTNGTATVYVVNSYVAEDDPSLLFCRAGAWPLQSPTTVQLAKSVSITNSSLVAGQLDVAAFSGAIGPFVRVYVEWVAGTTVGSVSLGVTLVGRMA